MKQLRSIFLLAVLLFVTVAVVVFSVSLYRRKKRASRQRAEQLRRELETQLATLPAR